MSARFRIRTAQGQEISFASHEMFAEFVRSGDLSPDDVVYDAETKEWSSALTHPVVLEIEADGEDEGVGGAGAPSDDESPEVAGEPTDAPDDDEALDAADIGLELAPAPAELTPEEQEAAFVAKMEAERASEGDLDDSAQIEGFKRERGSSGLVEKLEASEGLSVAPSDPFLASPEPTLASPEPPVVSSETPVVPEPPVRPSGSEAVPRREHARELPGSPAAPVETRREARTRTPDAPKRSKREKKGTGAGRRHAPLVIVGLTVLAAGAYFGSGLVDDSRPGEGDAADSEAVPEPPPPPEPAIPDTEEALRERAQERFLATTRALLRDLPPIPDVWLDGAYLASPSDYPEVREAWSAVLDLVRDIRQGDDERYRAGYVRALEDARVEGSARTLRLAAAVSDFQGTIAPRAAHYDRVEALASTMVRAHDALVSVEGTIAYQPAAGTAVSGDPVIEAVGRNAEAQEFLDDVLDQVTAQMDAPSGPGTAGNVSEWIWEGLLGAVVE